MLQKAFRFAKYYFTDISGQFTRAAAFNDRRRVDSLLDEYGPELINKTGITRSSALMNATMNGHYEMAEYLLSRKADVNYADHTGKTALMEAAFANNDAIYDLLVRHGANKAQRDEYGRDAAGFRKLGKQWGAGAKGQSSGSSAENVMTSPAHISHPLNIFNPFR